MAATDNKEDPESRTDVKLKALLRERVAASSSPVVLFQDQNFLSHFGQQHGKAQTSHSTADDDGIKVLRNFTGHKTCREQRHVKTLSSHVGCGEPVAGEITVCCHNWRHVKNPSSLLRGLALVAC